MTGWSIWDWLSALRDTSIIVTGALMSVWIVLLLIEKMR